MKTPAQQEFETAVQAQNAAYQKAGWLGKRWMDLKAVWLRLNLRFPIGLPCIVTAVVGSLILILLDSLLPGSFEQSRAVWWVVALVIEVVVVLTWVIRNLKLVEFVNRHLDESQKK